MNHPDDAILRIKRVRDSFGPERPGLKETRDAIEACDWDEARTRALLIQRGHAKEVPAKGCHGCRFAHGLTCSAAFATSVQRWQAQHLQPDLMTPKPEAPECPGRAER